MIITPFGSIYPGQIARRLYTISSRANLLKSITFRQLWNMGERAYGLRDMESVMQIADLMEPFSEDCTLYYKTLCDLRRPLPLAASALPKLDTLIDSDSDFLRARSHISRAGLSLRRGDLDHSRIDFVKALITAPDDGWVILSARRMLAILDSLEGKNQQALEKLSALLPVARAIRAEHPAMVTDYFNSLAIELIECGLIENARKIVSLLESSPALGAWPEWNETIHDERLKPASGKFFFIFRQKKPRIRKKRKKNNVLEFKPRGMEPDSEEPDPRQVEQERVVDLALHPEQPYGSLRTARMVLERGLIKVEES